MTQSSIAREFVANMSQTDVEKFTRTQYKCVICQLEGIDWRETTLEDILDEVVDLVRKRRVSSKCQ